MGNLSKVFRKICFQVDQISPLMDKQRKSDRHRLSEACVWIDGIPGTVSDISTSGIGVKLQAPFAENISQKQVLIEIRCPYGMPITVRGEIVRQIHGDQYGIRFLGNTQDIDRLIRTIASHEVHKCLGRFIG